MTARRILAGLLLAATGALAGTAALQLDRRAPRGAGAAQLLYLPNGKYLRLISLGHAPLVADLIYLWAIQFYSNYERADRFRYVRHVFGNVITELDPHYIDAYWLGAMILTVEAHDLEGGLALLDRGFSENPGQWVLPYLAAWECHLSGQAERATAYFEKAARVPGAPPVARRMHASMLARRGELETALHLWGDVRADPTSDDVSRAIAERKIREIRVRIDLRELEAAVARFRSDNGRNPRTLADLERGGYIAHVPTDPDGRAYRYDARSGEVSSAAGRVLRES